MSDVEFAADTAPLGELVTDNQFETMSHHSVTLARVFSTVPLGRRKVSYSVRQFSRPGNTYRYPF